MPYSTLSNSKVIHFAIALHHLHCNVLSGAAEQFMKACFDIQGEQGEKEDALLCSLTTEQGIVI